MMEREGSSRRSSLLTKKHLFMNVKQITFTLWTIRSNVYFLQIELDSENRWAKRGINLKKKREPLTPHLSFSWTETTNRIWVNTDKIH